jgi:RNA polymerase sigma-54 factor
MEIRVQQRAVPVLSPRLQHAVRLLQMSSLDFAALVRDKLGQNPFLEGDEGADGEEAELPPALAGGADATPRQAPGLDDGGPADDRELWHADGGIQPRRASDTELSALDLVPVDTMLNAHLHAQLSVLPLSARDLLLARAIVESLDDDGYLRTPLEELAALVELEPPATPEEMQIALRRVQALDPSGVAARGVAECLLLQLPKIDCPSLRGLARRIVEDHLQALAAHNLHALAMRLGEPIERVDAACERIRRLDPRPGWRFGSSQVAYVVPDVIVKRVRGRWITQLNPAVVPRVRLNQVYAELFQHHRGSQDGALAGHLQDARWTLRNVEQRFSTILDVASAIVRRQHHFLEFGAMAMKPLVLKEIAEEVGIHESTVSRVTNNKYIATPVGVFELKYFFSRPLVTRNGGACSATAIRGLIKEIIDAEQPTAPLSDAEITRQLARQGLVVARRTVTKYRQLLRIEPIERRRKLN